MLVLPSLVDFTGDVTDGKRGQLRFVMAGDNAKNDWEDYGSVTSLSFNCDHTRLLVGHSKGQVCVCVCVCVRACVWVWVWVWCGVCEWGVG